MLIPYDPQKHHRRSIRFKGYDYAQSGAYFLTLVAHQREMLFGEIVDGEMRLNHVGRMVQVMWAEMPRRFPGMELDVYVVMPNHMHAIVILVGASLVDAPGADTRPAPTGHTADAPGARAGTRPAPTNPTLGDIVGAFKSITTVEHIRRVKQCGWAPFPGRLWQRNYWEHIIRNEAALDRIREYIVTNPLRWALDRENPDRQGEDDFDRWLSSL